MDMKNYAGKVSGAQLREIAERLGELLEKKNHDYGGASFRMGLPGVYVHVTDKYDRFERAMKREGDLNFESIKDTLLDLAGYCIIGASMIEADEAEENGDAGLH